MALHLPPMGGGSSGGAHTQPSLPALPAHLQSDTHLTAHLASRFHVAIPTARLSSHGLISLNTYTSSTKGLDGGKEGSAMAGAEDIADRAYIRMGHRSENQAVLFLGESGSGKTTIRSHLLTALLNKSSTPLSSKISLAAYVFDSLTTTKTATTPTASKAGLFYELQYDTASTTNPLLIGGKLLDHRLERSRITSVPTGERNFHVLYYLLAGTSDAEKTHLGIDSPRDSAGQRRWKYLGHPTQLKVGINDTEGFQLFKTALRKLEFPRSEIAEICQILACILHIGQLEFESSANTLATGDDSGGFSHEGAQTITAARNKDVLGIIAAFLGVSSQDLQNTMGYKTKMIHRERVTVMLDPQGARANADELARTLYSLLVAYVIENINQKICAAEESIVNTIDIIDFPGFSQQTSTGSALDQLLNNAAMESLYNLTLQNFFDRKADMLDTEEVSVPATSYFDNSDAVKGLLKPTNGLLSILDDQTRRNRTDMQLLESLRKRFEGKNPAIAVGSATARLPGSNFLSENTAATFTVRHFAGEVEYPIKGLVEENGEVISGDLMNLIKSSKSEFVARLFGQEALQTIMHPQEKTTVMQASVSSKPMRAPSVMSRKGGRAMRSRRLREESFDDVDSEAGDARGQSRSREGQSKTMRPSEQGASGQFLSALENVKHAIASPNTNNYFVFCLKPNDRRIANQFDSKCVRAQVQTFGIAEISQRLRSADFSVFLPFGEFLGLADAETIFVGSEREKVEAVVQNRQWPTHEAHIGSTGIFLSERCWMEVASLGDGASASGRYPSDQGDTPGGDPQFGVSKEQLLSVGNTPQYSDKPRGGYFGSNDVDTRSEAGVSAFGGGDMFKNLDTREQMAERGNEKSLVEVEEYRDSASRKRWIFVVYMLTWFVPDFLIRHVGRMARKDVRMAWREKLAINFIIWFSCLFATFFIIVFPMLICPKQYVFSSEELSRYNGQDGHKSYASIRGQVFDIGTYAPHHYPSYISTKKLTQYAGLDITALFPVQVSALCQGKSGKVDPSVLLDYKSTNVTGSANVINSQDLNSVYHDYRYFTSKYQPDWFYERMEILKGGWKKGTIGYSAQYVKTLASKQNQIAILNGRVYDMTKYIVGGRHVEVPEGADKPTDPEVANFMDDTVLTLFTERAGTDLTELWNRAPMSDDLRSRMQLCLDNLFYVGDVDTRNSVKCQFAQYLILAVSIILVSIIGFKFLAALQFGGKNMPEDIDKFVMCQIPAYTEDEDSLRRAIDSAARMRYDDKRKLLVVICDGMIIGQGNDRPTPRIVGKPSEVSRPGNRGKRDSQMVLMRFLNRVHYNLPMSPLELEMFHQIRNVIGVNPTFYEYILQIDADTVVAPDSATRMVSAFLDDTRLIACCGETALTNSKSSFITMIQVYEYYISHNLSKAFESLFGSVTCLPGCFSMYRIRAADTGKPLFVSREVVEDYATIRVDTLHMKNLLHLGEDRYLTTLLLKYHSKYKTKYIFPAKAWTIAPDTWQVFISQRRRWINSTVHNLMELVPMSQLCGFCCFSMRFVVFIDLLSTVVQPVTIAYIIYLLVLVGTSATIIPITSFILLGAIYGLQAIIFILRRRWEMVGWLILYVLAVPVYSFGLPLYAFWHMDDFNWGNTRVVAGEKGKKVVISDEGKFDPASIPRKRWEEYQAELWEAQTSKEDTRSEISGFSYATKPGMDAAVSEYYHPQSRAGSTIGVIPPYDMKNPNNLSRMSFAPTDNRMSQFGGSQFFGKHGETEMMDMASMPSDDALLAEIREILRTADLMTVTKKGIKQELERRFNVPLESRRAYINSATEALLSGQL
ncbi:putative chitin synthase 8 [Rosellinia necatrix]|uniref:chitin synthase n=1 Tax=Rosellinia necatrix TaxID=77044 RepID=A0A1W2TX68_ROSNE|nr:putative chitin synthase 8 [Rosellinia necatrix]